MRSLLLLIIMLLTSSLVFSQLSQPCTGGQPIAYDDCSAACAVCDISVLNGVTFNSGGWQPDHVNELDYSCNSVSIVMNNNGWIGFVANATTLELKVVYSNCTGGNANVGMQALIVESPDCQNFVLKACKGDATAATTDSFNLVANGLVIGQSYYLVLDGYAGSVCDVSVEVVSGGGTPQVGVPAQFTGPSNLCPNETATFTFGPVPNALNSSWVLPPGAFLTNGGDPSAIPLNQNTPTTVQITFGASTTGNICVTAYNGCDAADNPSCLPVTVAPIPDTQLPPDTICYGETYTGIDGVSYTNNNLQTYATTFPIQTYFGGGSSGICDSLVKIDMIYLPSMVTNAPTIYACEGDTVFVGSTMVLSDQQITATATSQNGCDSVVNVYVDFIENNASANGPLTINCTNNAQLVGSGTTATGTYAWYDPSDNEISTSLTATANMGGQHYFVVTNTSNGFTCTDTAFVDVTADLSPPQNVTASAAGAIGCGANSSTQLSGSSTTPNAIFNWLDPSGNSISSTATATATQTGTFQFIATHPGSGCKDTVDVQVIADASIPDITALGGIIDCTTPNATISASSTTSGLDYSWSGPSGYTSTNASNTVTSTGSYTVVITDPSNGCTNSTSVMVADSTTPPSITTTGNIVGCNSGGVSITAVSNTGTTYSWGGPGSYASSLQNPNNITVPGNYTVTVTNPNGCTNTSTAVVASDTISPTLAPTGGTVSCNNPTVTLSANSNPSTGVSYSWSGPSGPQATPIFTSGLPGIYAVTVTNTLNGCTGTGSVTVPADTVSPTLNLVADAPLIDCNNPDVILSATTNGISYFWSGNGISGNTPSVTVTQGGTYMVEVEGANGCQNSQSIPIQENTTPPDVSAADVDITCTNLTPTINATSSVSPATYSWSGPNGFTANTASATITDDGQYFVTITDGTNGCTNTTSLMANNLVLQPSITTTNDSLGCGASATAQLTATSVTGANYSWTGPNSYVGTGSSILVNATGVYTVEVTAPNGCTNTATAEVFPNVDLPQLSTNSGLLDCSFTPVSLSATSTTTGVSFEWIDGNSSTTPGPSITVSTFDPYTVVATAPNGCTTSAIISAVADTIAPTLSGLTSSNDLDCNVTSSTLSVTSNGISYSWTGPNGFTSNVSSPSVPDGGVYTVVVTGQNSCTSTDNITVAQDTITPDVAVGDTSLNCLNTTATLTATSGATITNYSWTGPNGFSGNTAMVTVSDEGNYAVEVTAANGCKNTATGNVSGDFVEPNVSAVGGTLTCTNTSVDLMGNSMTSGATGVWTSGTSNLANDFPFSATSIGDYTLTVTALNGCTHDTTVTVGENILPPNADAVSLEPLTCTKTTVSIEGQSNTPNVSYAWTGPNGFTSGNQNPMVTDPGLYTLTTTDPINGCSNTDTVTVFLNANLPELTAAASGNLDCNTTSVLLTSTSSTSGVSYAWTGPGIGANPTDQDQDISIPGTYTIEVTAPNGCTKDTTFVVSQDTVSPQNVTATGGTILCGTSDIQLSGSTTTSGVSYTWVGPGNVTYPGQNPTVDEVGIYTLTVENLTNGCTATDTALVAEDINAPNADVSVTGTITCVNSTISILGSSTTPNVQYSWATPSGASLAGAGPHTVSEMGSYKLVVSAPNGCSTVKNIASPIDTISPGASTSPITLTCLNPNGTLTGSTNTSHAVNYSWSGPNGYSSSTSIANNIVDDGTYFLTVTDDANGCTSETNVAVLSNQVNPDIFANDGVINCQTPSIQIFAGSSTNGVTFSWTGPGGFTSTDTMPSVNVGGQYTLTVLDPISGCSSVAVAQIDEDKAPPVVSIDTVPLLITCAVPNVTLLGSSTTAGASFSWTGPNGFMSTLTTPTVTDPGLYQLTVKGPNGCTATDSKNVDKDSDFPILATQVDDTLTCAVNAVDIHVSETTGKTMTYSWSGPGGFSSTDADATVSEPGTYTVEGTASNGCKVTSQAMVSLNDTKPLAVAGGAFEIDCTVLDGTLNATGSATGNHISYQWSTPTGHIVSGGDTANPLVDGPGTYELVVTDARNGCTNSATVIVTADPAIPNDLKLNIRQISCYGENDGVAVVEEVIGGTPPFQFSFNGGAFDSKLNFTELGPGDYPISVVDANGCKLNTGISIVEPELFTIDLGPDRVVTYGDEVQVNALVNDTKRVAVVGWNTFLDSTCLLVNPMKCYEQRFVALSTTTFEVAATDTSGCDASDRMMLFVEKPKNVYFPNIFSPNGDSYNSGYYISTGKGVALIKSFVIMDRWGNMVTKVNDIQPGQNILVWDGNFNGAPVNPGVFIYQSEVLFLNGEKETYVGDITVIR